ncbi:hypothetical protein GGP41_003909 [Bipolaris sorokiniana]|uniref:Uncharacterized protein n=1 Tax=Cochliobolus sativus TaxID=45130 RepID=A0A8H5Z7L1_COCSA|nr:hypothetical protein GGP41_003909 [Bipolaris sorokiniana]
MSSSDAELIVAHQACREVISYIKPSEIVGPYGGISIREESNYRLVSNPSPKWVLASTLRGASQNQKKLQAGDLDEKYQQDHVTEVLVSRMTLLIAALREKPSLSDDQLAKKFSYCTIQGLPISRALFPNCSRLGDSVYHLRRIRDLAEAMRDQLELGDQFNSSAWASLILKRKQSKDKQAREEREAETMELGEAEDAKTKKVVPQIR